MRWVASQAPPDPGGISPRRLPEFGDPPVTEGHGAVVTSLIGSFDEIENDNGPGPPWVTRTMRAATREAKTNRSGTGSRSTSATITSFWERSQDRRRMFA